MVRRNENDQIASERSLSGRAKFLFLGGNLALDLVNTEVKVRGKRKDLLLTPQDAAQWWEIACQVHTQAIQGQGKSEEWDEQQLVALRSLRKTLRRLFEALAAQAQVQESDMQELNIVLQDGYYALERSPEGQMVALYRARLDRAGSVELPVAFAALTLLTEQDLSRLHTCQNERCMLLFYDTTRSATRHWCRVACTNRARSRQHYRQAKEAFLQ